MPEQKRRGDESSVSPVKKSKTSHLYEKIARAPVADNITPIQGQNYIASPHVVEVIGVPFSAGQPKPGAEIGPSMMIQAGVLDQLEVLGWKVECPDRLPSYEHLEPKNPKIHPKLKNVEYVAKVTEAVSKKVRRACDNGHLALTLGGDHSLGMATVAGSLSVHPDAGVIWVDAHADINTAETSDSGNIHGCPVSFLMGLGEKIKEFAWLKPLLKTNKIVFIGLRDIDEGEKKILKENKIRAYSMHEVDKYGIGEVMRQTFEYLGENSPIHLSFDVDALDPTVAPATGTAVRGGLTFREGHYICEEVHATGRLVAMDLVEVNPLLGADEMASKTTVNIGCSLIRATLGESLL